jgi:hypothetical protein
MKVLITSLVLLAFAATPCLARDMAKDPGIYIEGVPQAKHHNEINNRQDEVGVAMIWADGVFPDMSPAYCEALAEIDLVCEVIYDPMGNWEHDRMCWCWLWILFGDMWWDGWWLLDDEIQVGAYLDEGGLIALIGQDYLYARGGIEGFPQDYLGVVDAYQDANFGDTYLTWVGSPGGPLDGYSGEMTSDGWPSNDFYTDEIVPAEFGVMTWESAMYGPAEGGSAGPNYIFSTVEWSFDWYWWDWFWWIRWWYWWWPTATEDVSFSTLKSMY